jgi:hypothetical protein
MTIAEFLLELAKDEKLLKQFRADPAKFLTAQKKLTAKQRALLGAGKLVDLRVVIDAEFEVAGETIAMHTIYGTPQPQPPPRP